MLRSVVTKEVKTNIWCSFNRTASRTFISKPEIPFIDSQRDQGIKGLYTSKGLQTAYYDIVDSSLPLLEESVESAPNRASLMNAIESTKTKNAELQLESLIKTSIKTPDSYAVFNIASKIYNNYFSISSLVGNANPDAQISKPNEMSMFQMPILENEPQNGPRDYLRSWIIDSFGSMIEFKTLLLNSCSAIKGNGYTWVVARGINSQEVSANFNTTRYINLFVVNTYNGGTPGFEGGSGQVQALTKQLKHATKAESEKGVLDPDTIVKLPTVEEAEFQMQQFDQSFYLPLLAINGSPYAYLPDYGVFGKKHYLENVWNSIDWQTVSARLPNSNERPKFKAERVV